MEDPVEQDNAEFSFSWLALKLLGKGLYSNAWNALSELVANGLDAGATEVCILLDRRETGSSRIYVLDNGIGMTRDEISSYVKVGYDKRKTRPRNDRVNLERVNGRKGIGKLAALYLSPVFQICTKSEDGESFWRLDSQNISTLDEHPVLRRTLGPALPDEVSEYASYETGTLIILEQVDLKGYGNAAHNSLGNLLANQFLLTNGNERSIKLAILESAKDSFTGFEKVEKMVAYKNLAFLKQSAMSSTDLPPELLSLIENNHKLFVKAQGIPGGKYEHTLTSTPFNLNGKIKEFEKNPLEGVSFKDSTYNGHPFALTGWIGIHATINQTEAIENDNRFTKNKFFNPAQLRIYVRGKLATDRLLSQLGITGTFLNYIEGELSFDILDNNELEDIATSNRQDFDENDVRVSLLRTLVRSLVRDLINQRSELRNRIREEEGLHKVALNNRGKDAFAQGLAADLERYEDISDQVKFEIQTLATNKIQGDIETKSQYKIFLSHSSKDLPFTGFVYELLISRGVLDDEIFYTSKSNGQYSSSDMGSLGEIIKTNIVDSNTLIIYFNSRNFLGSQYCLFEGGAGWATRAVGAVGKVNVDYGSIPQFLSENRPETTILYENKAELRPELYQYFVQKILNPAIEHINVGRNIRGEDRLRLFPVIAFPSEVQMTATQKTYIDYYEADIISHWNVHVLNKMEEYIKLYQNAGNVK
jgi:hypothetical protein